MQARFLIVVPPQGQSSTIATLAIETERALAAATGTRFAKRYLGYAFSEDVTAVPDMKLIALSAWSADPVSLRTAWTNGRARARRAPCMGRPRGAHALDCGRLVERLRAEH